LFTNYAISKKKKLKPKQTYIERLSFQYASYLRVNWPRCEGTPPIRCGIAMEEEASQVGEGATSWSAPKDKSSSLLEELAAAICSRHVDFILRFYTNWMNNYIIKFDYLKKNRQHLPYTGDYPNFSKPANIDNVYTTNHLILF
jgi:hypothetical protein